MRSPFIWVAFFLSLGIWISSIIQIPILFAAVAVVSSITASLATIKGRTAAFVWLSVAFLFIGCLVFQARHLFPPDHIKNFTAAERREAYLEGTVADEPLIGRTFYGGRRISFTLDADRLRRGGIRYEVTGKARVSVSGEAGTELPSYGDRILAKGMLSRPEGPGNPGGFDYAKYLERAGIFSLLTARPRDIAILERGKGNPVISFAYKVRGAIRDLISTHLPGDSANFLNAILLGLRHDIGDDLNDAFMKTGTIHLIAISGLNVGLIAFLVLLILGMVRIPRRAAIAVSIVFLIFYAILTNGTPSVVRATIMSIAVLFGLLLEREASLWNCLGLSAVAILGYDPNALFDIGFQLSFVSVMSILYMTPKLEKFFRYDRKIVVRFLPGWRRYILEGLLVSLAAFLGVTPIILYNFNIITPISPLSNLIAVPLSFLITAASVPFILFGFFFPPAAEIFGAAVSFLCGVLFNANGFLSKAPFAYLYLPSPPLPLIALYYLIVIAFAEHERIKLAPAKLTAFSLIVFNVVVWTGALRPNDGKLKATFLDVGHGDSVYVEFPYGGNMLVDGGPGGGEDRDSGRDTVLPFLRQKGVQVLDAVVLTHPDIDHVGGLASVLKGLKVRYVFDNGASSDTYAYRRFREEISDKRMEYSALSRDDSIERMKGVGILCLNPPAEWIKDAGVPANDLSLAMKVTFGDASMLLCGDIGERAISELLSFSPRSLKADLIMLPHHGARLGAEGEIFVEAVRPSYAVISQGKTAREVSGSEETGNLLSAKGIKVFRTNSGGAVFAVCGRDFTLTNAALKYKINLTE